MKYPYLVGWLCVVITVTQSRRLDGNLLCASTASKWLWCRFSSLLIRTSSRGLFRKNTWVFFPSSSRALMLKPIECHWELVKFFLLPSLLKSNLYCFTLASVSVMSDIMHSKVHTWPLAHGARSCFGELHRGLNYRPSIVAEFPPSMAANLFWGFGLS